MRLSASVTDRSFVSANDERRHDPRRRHAPRVKPVADVEKGREEVARKGLVERLALGVEVREEHRLQKTQCLELAADLREALPQHLVAGAADHGRKETAHRGDRVVGCNRRRRTGAAEGVLVQTDREM